MKQEVSYRSCVPCVCVRVFFFLAAFQGIQSNFIFVCCYCRAQPRMLMVLTLLLLPFVKFHSPSSQFHHMSQIYIYFSFFLMSLLFSFALLVHFFFVRSFVRSFSFPYDFCAMKTVEVFQFRLPRPSVLFNKVHVYAHICANRFPMCIIGIGFGFGFDVTFF